MRNVVGELSKIRQTMAQTLVDLSQLSQRMGMGEPESERTAEQNGAPAVSDRARLNSLISRFEGLVQWLKVETTAGTQEMEALKQRVELHRQSADKQLGVITEFMQAFARQLTAVENKNAALDAGLAELTARLNSVDQLLGSMMREGAQQQATQQQGWVDRHEPIPAPPADIPMTRASEMGVMGGPAQNETWPEDPALR